MSLKCQETLKRLYALKRLGIRPGLEAIRGLLRILGNPEKGLCAVHIAGTNGKGSTAAMMESVIRASGYRTGLYTSPHLQVFNERIRVSGRAIPDDDLARTAGVVLKASKRLSAHGGPEPTFFEAATAMAFLHFRERDVEIAILETGMGGRLDATNVVDPIVSIITGVAMDHRAFLGDNPNDIASEKAGIIKKGVPVVSGVLEPRPARVIEERAAELNSPILRLGREFSIEEAPDGKGFDYRGTRGAIKDLETGLIGAHQKRNAALALAGLEVLVGSYPAIGGAAIREGLRGVRWPGRFEVIGDDPGVILDCAHNPEGARALAEALGGFLPPGSPITLVLGISRDKDIKGILASLLPLARRVIFTEACPERAAPTAALIEAVGERRGDCIEEPTMAGALGAAFQGLAPGEAVVVAGSIFVVGEARDLFRRRAGKGIKPFNAGVVGRSF